MGAKNDTMSFVLCKGMGLVAGITLLWVGFEYLRSTLFTGFPWNAVGISQYRSIVIIQIAELGGVYAVSAVVLLVNTALMMMIMRFVDTYGRRRKARFNIELATGLLVWVVALSYGMKSVRHINAEYEKGTQVRIGIEIFRQDQKLI